MEFFIVDVFAEEKYAGNQLAVFRGGEGLSTREMQKLALEMNYSETTFILRDAPRDGGFDVRIFTPAEEVPFAGHPTLGTAFIIQQEIIRRPVESVTLNLAVGQIPVAVDYVSGQPDLLTMHQNPPDFGETFDPEPVAAALSISPADIDSRFPVQDVSTGLPFIIVPLRSRNAIKRCRVNLDAYEFLVAGRRSKSIFMFCPEPYSSDNHLNARMYSPEYGIVEDPATGSANGCLAGYLVRHRYFGTDSIDVLVEQGYEIDRPSLLNLRAAERGGTIDVFVGGRVHMVARATLC